MFHHEKLDVYRLSISFTGYAYRLCRGLTGADRHARDQLLRASQSIPLNIAEGNGRLPSADRQRFLRTALGSALECASILDVLLECDVITSDNAREGKEILVRIAAMLTKMTTPSREVLKEPGAKYITEPRTEHDYDDVYE